MPPWAPPGAESADRSFGVYVHVPYCSSRCGYCDFNTYVPGESGRGTQSHWRSAALTELDLARKRLPDAPAVNSIFIGGGTPTLLPVSDLAAVISGIDAAFGFAAQVEITVEANPETVTPGVIDDLLTAGVNRLSLGMQSADARVLAVLDRRHSPGGAVAAARLSQLAGFDRVSLDLIYGTPGESLTSWRDTVATALETGVTHVSAYSLKVEPGTAMHRRVSAGQMPAPDDDFAATAYEIADDLLSGAGLDWYEISNWSSKGHECQHNLGYWRGADWWGMGPGAHSHVAGQRWWNERSPITWVAALAAGVDPRAGSETLTPRERLTEFVMLAIRLAEGLDLSRLRPPEGGSSAALTATVAELVSDDLAVASDDRLRLTRKGRRLADAVTLRLLAAVDPSA